MKESKYSPALRRTAAILLALVMLFALLTAAAAEPSPSAPAEKSTLAGTGGSIIFFLNGDADGDNRITILDATLIQRVLASLSQDKDGLIALRGDVNQDGLNILDATSIQRYLAGYSNTRNIGLERSAVIGGSVELPEDPL